MWLQDTLSRNWPMPLGKKPFPNDSFSLLAFTLEMILPTLLETRTTMSIHDCDSRIPSLVYTTADKTSASGKWIGWIQCFILVSKMSNARQSSIPLYAYHTNNRRASNTPAGIEMYLKYGTTLLIGYVNIWSIRSPPSITTSIQI